MVAVAVLAAVLSLASFAAFFGRWVWWLDVLANFRLQFALGLALLFLLLMVGRWKRTAYGVGVAAAVNLALIGPLFLGPSADPVPDAPELRVMSFNLLSTNESYSDVIEFIRATDPDVVLLHEASRPWEVALEAAELGYALIRPRADRLIFGTLVLVRSDDPEVISYGFAETQPRAVSISYRPRGWPVAIEILSTHPLAPTEEERARLRDAQLEFAGEWVAKKSGPVVVVGDFNATPWSWPFRDLAQRSDLANSQDGFGFQASFPTESNLLFRVPIDHLLHSEDLIVTDRRLGPAMGSDHFPLLVDLQLKTQRG